MIAFYYKTTIKIKIIMIFMTLILNQMMMMIMIMKVVKIKIKNNKILDKLKRITDCAMNKSIKA